MVNNSKTTSLSFYNLSSKSTTPSDFLIFSYEFLLDFMHSFKEFIDHRDSNKLLGSSFIHWMFKNHL